MKTDTPDSLAPVLLSPVESYFWRFEEDSQAFRTCGVYRVEGRVDESVLKIALHTLQRRHPKLRAKIVEGNDGRLRYVFPNPAPPIPYKIQDYDGVKFPWRDEARRLLDSKLPPEGPLAAVAVLRSRTEAYSEILIMSTHAFTDGLSSLMLMDNLLTAYAQAEAGLDTSADPMLPCVSAAYARAPRRWRDRIALFRRFIRLKREESRCVLTSLPEHKGVPSLSQWEHWVFTADETAQLVKRLRKERTSLNGVLMTAVSFGLTDSLAQADALYRWQVPFSLRESLSGSSGPVKDDDLGCFVTNMNGYTKIDGQSSFWDLARKTQDEIQLFKKQGGPTFGYNAASFFYDQSTNLHRLIRRPPKRLPPREKKRVTMLANNYGLVNIRKSYGSLRPRAITGIYKHEQTGPSLSIEALVLGQELNIGFSADGLEPAFWERLQTSVMGYIRSAIGTVRVRIEATAVPRSGHAEASAHRMRVAAQE